MPSKKNTYKYVAVILSQIYPNAKLVMTDYELALTSICTQQICRRLQIIHTKTSAFHSKSNRQVEHTRSTIIEIGNKAVHSVINENVKNAYNRFKEESYEYKSKGMYGIVFVSLFRIMRQ